MIKEPYLQDQSPTAVTLMWQLEAAAESTITVTGPGLAKPLTVALPASRLSEATLTQLLPASRYTYRIAADGGVWDGALATAPAAGVDVPFTFLVVGDSRNGLDAHRRVITQMATESPDFVVGTGDMVDNGADDSEWDAFFAIDHAVMRNTVFFPCLGNHDRGKRATADAFRAYFAVPENGAQGRYYSFTYAATRFLILDSTLKQSLPEETAWLEQELKQAAADPTIRHVFPVLHYPVFSIALHGGNKGIRDAWNPLFLRYHVTAVLSGHDHVYERAEDSGMRYFVSGGGGAPLYKPKKKPDPADVAAVKIMEKAHHYLRIAIAGARVEVTAIREDGTTIETTAWTDAWPPTPQPPATPAPRAGNAPEQSDAAPPDAAGSARWMALAGVGLMLAAAVIVVRTLRR